MAGITPYLDILTSEYRLKPKLVSWLSAPLNMVNDGVTMCEGIPGDFDIDTAVGVQLDVLGQIIGRGRQLPFNPSSGTATLSDDDYRTALKAKIAQNNWDGTIPGMYAVWNAAFPNAHIQIIDNQDMTMQVLVNGTLSTVARDMIAAGMIIPKPMAVGFKVIETTDINAGLYAGSLVSGRGDITITANVPE